MKFLFIIITLLLLIMIFLLSTRSVWVGITIASTSMVFMLGAFGNRLNISKRNRVMISVVALVFLIGGLTIINIGGKNNPYSTLGRLKNIASPHAGNNSFRLKIWEITTKMINDHPITGVGAGNWKINSPYYYKGYDFEKKQLNWLRPHNDYLWVFAEKGVFGILIFISIFGFTLFYLLRIIFSDSQIGLKVFSLFLVSGIICYLVVSFFTFPLERINQQVYVAMILASTITIHYQKREKRQLILNKYLFLVPAALVLLFSIAYSYSVVKQEFMVREARIAQFRNDWNGMLRISEKIPSKFRTLDAEAMPVAWYKGLANANLNQTAKACDAYELALKAHPTKIMVMNNLGRTYFQMKEYEKARGYFLNALDILPNYFEALVNISSTYYQLGEYQNAVDAIEKIPPYKRNEPIKKNLRAFRRKLNSSQ